MGQPDTWSNIAVFYSPPQVFMESSWSPHKVYGVLMKSSWSPWRLQEDSLSPRHMMAVQWPSGPPPPPYVSDIWWLHIVIKSHDHLDLLCLHMSQTYDGCTQRPSHMICLTTSAIICPRHGCTQWWSHMTNWTTPAIICPRHMKAAPDDQVTWSTGPPLPAFVWNIQWLHLYHPYVLHTQSAGHIKIFASPSPPWHIS